MRHRQVALVAVFVAACSSPAAPSDSTIEGRPILGTAPPVTTPTPTVLGQLFQSARYGYQLTVPDEWEFTETPGSGGVHPDEPGVDTFKDWKGHILSIVGEPAIGSFARWTCATNLHLTGEHALPAVVPESIAVAGEPARLSSHHLEIRPYVIHYLVVEVARGGRGLTLSLESTTKDDAGDRAVFDEILASFAFTA